VLKLCISNNEEELVLDLKRLSMKPTMTSTVHFHHSLALVFGLGLSFGSSGSYPDLPPRRELTKNIYQFAAVHVIK
jgi:hypothetical protein